REAIDEFFFLPEFTNRDDVIKGVSYLARTTKIDRVVALDDYDVELAAVVREHLRCPGMGDTTARYFRDKLAMRVKARDHGILVPDFVHVLNYDDLRHYMETVPAPWVLKPRSEAAAIGIKKIHSQDQLWAALETLGDRQSYYLLERYVPGDIFHIDSIVAEREVAFAAGHKYGQPPMDVAHEGGIFISRTLPQDSVDAQALESLNRELLSALGLVRGVTHTEFIKGHEDGRFYFLETASRVGGANIAEMVEAVTGVNLWHEWAKIEILRGESVYHLPEHRDGYAGILISLARQERPDTSAYDDPEVVWRLEKDYHVGLIVASEDSNRVDDLLASYAARFREDFFATAPLPDRPTD
ncbi:MAG: ATP-grasp domain-containing protein, partial [Actinomycetota bacterium]|nr:ATP-grasp domain-containing protein [Actinomycetota bacterium]